MSEGETQLRHCCEERPPFDPDGGGFPPVIEGKNVRLFHGADGRNRLLI